jgi:multiple antibiotic resistance protein
MIDLSSFTRAWLLIFVLLNPFAMSVFLLPLVKSLDLGVFARQLARAALISFVVFALFAWTGETIFANVLQVRFFAFQIFGGVTFLIIGIRLLGQMASLSVERGDQDAAASIAMPFMVGPGTISASVLAGARLDPTRALLAIALALGLTVLATLAFKRAHDLVRAHNERLVHRYTEVVGRVTGLFTGSFAIDMILRGVEGWLAARGV